MGIFDKAKEGLANFQKEAESMLMEEMLEKFLPKIKKMIPKVEEASKKFLTEKEAIIIIKQEKNGDITASVLKKSAVNIVPKEGVNSVGDMFVKTEQGENMQFSMEQLIELMTSGAVEKLVKSK